MNVEQALKVADEAIFSKTGRHLSDIQTAILRGSWENQTYNTIAEKYRCDEQHAKNEGAIFWKLLSEALGETVTKTNFREALERRERSHSEPPPSPQQPQRDETVSKDTDFVGREEAIADIDNLVNEGEKVILIQAEGGIGKTTLARKWFELRDVEYLELRVGTTPQNLNSVEDWVRQKLRDYFEEIPEQNFFTMLEQLKELLQTQEIGILIDNLEPALINGKFIESHQSYYVELLRVLAHPSVESVTLITSRERLHESAVKNCKLYQLDGLEMEAWQQYFEKRKIIIDVNDLIEMRRAYGGNAEAMSLLGADILNESQGNLQVYWQDNRDDLLRHPTLEDLVKRQFDKLRNDNLQAYKLLCRFGYYPADRYVDFVPKVWLFCLLWDVPEKRQQRVVDALCDRSLVKVSDEGYYLHPVIQAKAVERFSSIAEYNDNQWLLIKRQIDTLLASDQELQRFLRWVKEKSCSIIASVKLPYKPAAIRAFYFGIEDAHAIDDEFRLDFPLDLAYNLGLDNLDCYCLSCEDRRALFNSLGLDDALQQVSVWSEYGSVPPDEFEDILHGDIDIAPELKEELERLKEQLPESDKDPEKYRKWWKANGQTWNNQLNDVMMVYRNIGHYWELSYDQKELLSNYYEANMLLVECLYNNLNVTPEVRSHIEDTLLLPIAEIEKRQLRD